MKTIYLAGGCFWGCEEFFRQFDGILHTVVGYANGNTENPTYEDVKHRGSGHAETVKIDFDNSHTREVEQVDISKIAKGRDFKDLIGDFYKEIYGVEISEEEMAVMRMVGREAGVFHEAD